MLGELLATLIEAARYADMTAIMRALLAVGYGGTVTHDHTPRLPGVYEAGGGPAFGLGYIRALLDCLGKG
jgi:D-mannonate dehydratase